MKAAEDHRVDWIGFGGTSAGSIVATLSACGYTASELKGLIVDRPFTDLLDDTDGKRIDRFARLGNEVASALRAGLAKALWRLVRTLWRHRAIIQSVRNELGLYEGDTLRSWLAAKIKTKLPSLGQVADITFDDLIRGGCKPLKIVASDVSLKCAVVYPDDTGERASVLDAVRASTCYPLVFRPVSDGAKRLVDGGVCSNLPAFLFGEEARRRRVSVIAIDLVPKIETVASPAPGLARYAADLLDTMLEGSDKLLRARLRNLHHVQVEIDPPVHAMQFNLTEQQRRTLFQNGEAAFHSYYAKNLKPLEQARNPVQMLQALYGSPDLVTPVLAMLAFLIEGVTGAAEVRSHVMLPTLRETRIVVYQHGMNGMADSDLEVGLYAGCSGQAFKSCQPAFADLADAHQNFAAWGLSSGEQAKIPRNRRAMISVPIFDTGEIPVERKTVDKRQLPVIATLSIDTTVAPDLSTWVTPAGSSGTEVVINSQILDLLESWADIIGRLLS